MHIHTSHPEGEHVIDIHSPRYLGVLALDLGYDFVDFDYFLFYAVCQAPSHRSLYRDPTKEGAPLRWYLEFAQADSECRASNDVTDLIRSWRRPAERSAMAVPTWCF